MGSSEAPDSIGPATLADRMKRIRPASVSFVHDKSGILRYPSKCLVGGGPMAFWPAEGGHDRPEVTTR
jgi:hypothetical protein